MVPLPAQRPAIHANGRWCMWMYETRNETVILAGAESCGPYQLALVGVVGCLEASQRFNFFILGLSMRHGLLLGATLPWRWNP
jgi:hypothetical protein